MRSFEVVASFFCLSKILVLIGTPVVLHIIIYYYNSLIDKTDTNICLEVYDNFNFLAFSLFFKIKMVYKLSQIL
jgi:hypothetical protein